MPGATVSAANVLAADLRTEFADLYEPTYTGLVARLGDLMDFNLTAESRISRYGYFESSPNPVRHPRGEEISFDGFDSVTFTVTSRAYARGISWDVDDQTDDKTGTLMDRARGLGRRFALLDERIAFQLLLSTVDTDLLPAIPLSADGVALFSATDATGAARFGAAGGNIRVGSTTGTAQNITDDYWGVVQRFKLMQDTTGEPLWDDSILDQGFYVIYGATNQQRFAEAFTRDIIQATAAGVSSELRADPAILPDLLGTQRITDDDWFVGLKGATKQPLFKATHDALTERFFTPDMDPDLAKRNEAEISWRFRAQYSIALPYGIIQVNN